MKPAHIIALAVIAISMVVTLIVFAGTTAHHVTVAEAMKNPGEQVQVPGDIVKDTVRFDTTAGRGSLRFDVTDPKDPDSRMSIVYEQPKPENFDSAEKVEAVGQFKNGEFHATNLLVKCPSKYNDQPAKG